MSNSTKTRPNRKHEIEQSRQRPKALRIISENIPNDLKQLKQWIVWKYKWKETKETGKETKGKWDKPPLVARTPKKSADTSDSATWGTFEDALSVCREIPHLLDGIGYVFHPDTFECVGIDLDDCRNPETGEIEEWAVEIIKEINSYTEISPSGTGVKILAKGKLTLEGRKLLGAELYDSGRYFTITGNTYGEFSLLESRQAEIDRVHQKLIDKKRDADAKKNNHKTQTSNTNAGSNGKVTGSTFLTDQELIEKASKARGTGNKFRAFMAGSWSHRSQSEADLAFCNLIVFWTDDYDQVRRIVAASEMMRSKWERDDYAERTIKKAFEGRTNRYDPQHNRRGSRPILNGHAKNAEAANPSDPSNQSAPNSKPEIQGNRRQLPDVTADALQAILLKNDPPTVFQRGGLLTRIKRTEICNLRIEPLGDAALRGVLARAADWFAERIAKDGERIYIPDNPPIEVVKDLLNLNEWPDIPPLRGIIECPVFTREGELIQTAGYDRASGLLYQPAKELHIDAVHTHPSADAVKDAAKLLGDELLGDFPFIDDASRAHALAALLLPFVRQLIDGPTPLHLADAPTEGTGKTLLTSVITGVATGRDAEPLAEVETIDEWRKRITSLLVEGQTFVLLDNINRTLDAGALASVLTSRMIRDRVLGSNTKTITAPNIAVWLASGNNTRISRELIRRTLWIRLDAKIDTPWLRPATVFRHPNLLAWTKAHRGKLIHAALTIVQGWIAAGRPAGTATLGMFDEWAAVIGGILDFVEVPGLLKNTPQFRESCTDQADEWRVFVLVWWKKFAHKEVGVDVLYRLVNEEKLLNSIVGDKGDRSQRTRLGKCLSKAVDRVFGNLRIERGEKDNSGRQQYHLMEVAGVPQSAESATAETTNADVFTVHCSDG